MYLDRHLLCAELYPFKHLEIAATSRGNNKGCTSMTGILATSGSSGVVVIRKFA